MSFLPPEGGSHPPSRFALRRGRPDVEVASGFSRKAVAGVRLPPEGGSRENARGLRVRVMISTGEPSGDMYAAELARRIRAREPAAVITGFGGERLRAAGADLLGDFSGLSVTGLLEVARVLPRTYAMFRRLVAAARRDRPDVFVAVDFPDFNFRLAAAIRRLGVPIVYYISPQLWAWRPGRMKTMRALADRVLVIFPFEEQIYRDAGVPGAVGRASAPRRHAAAAAEGPARPHLGAVGRGADRRAAAGQPPQRSAGDSARPRGCGKPHPGPAARRAVRRRPRPAHFRRSAWRRWARFRARRPSCSTGRPTSSCRLPTSLSSLRGRSPCRPRSTSVRWWWCTACRLSPTGSAGRSSASAPSPWPTWSPESRVVPELIQDDFTPESVAAEALDILTNRARAAGMREDLRKVRLRLGTPGASDRAAQAVLEVARHGRATGLR